MNIKIKYNLRKRKHTDEEDDKGKYYKQSFSAFVV